LPDLSEEEDIRSVDLFVGVDPEERKGSVSIEREVVGAQLHRCVSGTDFVVELLILKFEFLPIFFNIGNIHRFFIGVILVLLVFAVAMFEVYLLILRFSC